MDRLDLERCLAEVRLHPDDHRAWQALGVAYIEATRWNDAVAAYERALTLAPDNVPAAEGLILAARQSGRWTDAETALAKATTAPASLGRGLSAFQRGDMAAASAAFRDAVGQDPSRAEAWYDLAAALANQEQWEAAAEAFKRFVSLEPSDVAGWRGLGRAESGARRHAAAADAYQRAIDIGGDAAACHLQLGKALGDTGRWAEAAHALREAARLDPRNPAVFIALAFAYDKMAAAVVDPRWPRERCLRAEVGALEAALRLEADTPTVWRSLARAREGLGDHQGAREAVAHASALGRKAQARPG